MVSKKSTKQKTTTKRSKKPRVTQNKTVVDKVEISKDTDFLSKILTTENLGKLMPLIGAAHKLGVLDKIGRFITNKKNEDIVINGKINVENLLLKMSKILQRPVDDIRRNGIIFDESLALQREGLEPNHFYSYIKKY